MKSKMFTNDGNKINTILLKIKFCKFKEINFIEIISCKIVHRGFVINYKMFKFNFQESNLTLEKIDQKSRKSRSNFGSKHCDVVKHCRHYR